MHPEAREFAHKVLSGKHFGTVVEVGGRDINGRITDSFTCDQYISLDLEPGANVDVVCDALDWSPTVAPDLVICMEVLEHEPRQRQLIEHMLSWLGEDGALLITAGGPGRPAHSAIDGGPLREGEPYKNLDPKLVIEIFQAEKLFPAEVHYNAEAKDTYAFGVVQIGEPAEVENTIVRAEDLAEPVGEHRPEVALPAEGVDEALAVPTSSVPGRFLVGSGPEMVDVKTAVPHQCPEDCRGAGADRWGELHKLVAIAGSEPAQ